MLRFGIVLADGPGALGRLVLVTKLLIGGPLASGRQWWSWVSLNDAVRSLLFLLDHELSGPVNIATPNPETQKKFATTLGNVLRRPAVIPAPGFAIRMALGEMGTHLLLDSTRLNPETLVNEGFEFEDPHLQEALRKLTILVHLRTELRKSFMALQADTQAFIEVVEAARAEGPSIAWNRPQSFLGTGIKR